MAARARSIRNKPETRTAAGFKFKWQNFRSFEDTGWIDVRPITIVIGANNSGKTSLIRPLLLMKQTLESGDAKIALKTTGPLTNVGRFKDFVFAHEAGREITFSIRFHERDPIPVGKKIKPILDYPPDEIAVQFKLRKGKVNEIELSQFSARDAYRRPVLTRRLLADSAYSVQFPVKLEQAFGKLAATEDPVHFLFPGYTLIEKLIEGTQGGKTRRRSSPPLRLSKHASIYLSLLQYVTNHFETLTSRLSYIGPLRDHPRRFYERKEEIPATVGLRGEDTAQILFLKKDRQFQVEITNWLRKMGLASEVWCTEGHEGIFALEVRDPMTDADLNFADTGFGLSQILPLVVQAFHSPKRSIMFFEQPEIHLNPKLQCELSNLLAAVADSQKMAIVETHSEHLVLRVRSLIAEGKLRAEDVALYFVERVGKRSTVRLIPIHEDGSIDAEQWPRGFFEESLVEALRLARPLRQVKG